MVTWRTNRQTKKPFPVAPGQNADAIERQNQEQADGEIIPEEEESYVCAGCGKSFVGQAYEIEGEIVCPECNRLDNKLQREEEKRQSREQVEQPVEEIEKDDEREGNGGGWWGSGLS